MLDPTLDKWPAFTDKLINWYICPLIYRSIRTGKKLPLTFDIHKSEVFSSGLCIVIAGTGLEISDLYGTSDTEINYEYLRFLVDSFKSIYIAEEPIINIIDYMLNPFDNDWWYFINLAKYIDDNLNFETKPLIGSASDT